MTRNPQTKPRRTDRATSAHRARDVETAAISETTLDESLAYQLRVTYKRFMERLQPLLDEHDIPIGMWYYLRALWEHDGLTQREISDRVGLVAPTSVEQLRNMENSGLLERRRSAQDRRKIHIYLTPKGRALRAKMLPRLPALNRVAVRGLSAGEIGFLRLVLSRIQSNLEPDAAVAEPETSPAPRAGRRRRAS